MLVDFEMRKNSKTHEYCLDCTLSSHGKDKSVIEKSSKFKATAGWTNKGNDRGPNQKEKNCVWFDQINLNVEVNKSTLNFEIIFCGNNIFEANCTIFYPNARSRSEKLTLFSVSIL